MRYVKPTRYGVVRYDAGRILRDLSARGWMATDLARAAGLHVSTVSLFLAGKRQTPKSARAIAQALGYSPRRYLVSSNRMAAAS